MYIIVSVYYVYYTVYYIILIFDRIVVVFVGRAREAVAGTMQRIRAIDLCSLPPPFTPSTHAPLQFGGQPQGQFCRLLADTYAFQVFLGLFGHIISRQCLDAVFKQLPDMSFTLFENNIQICIGTPSKNSLQQIICVELQLAPCCVH